MKKQVKQCFLDRKEEYAMEANNDLMSAKELSEFLNVPISWVYHRTSEGTIPFYKFGKYLRFKKDEIMKNFKKEENA